MTLNLISGIKKKFPNHEIHYFCNVNIGAELAPLFEAAGIDAWFDNTTLNVKQGDYKQVFNLIGYPIPPKGNYPEEPMKKHLLHYFAEECGLPISKELPQLKLPALPRLVEKKYATIHSQAGWSVYKNFSMNRWEQVIRAFPEIRFVQIGAATDYRLEGADHLYMGAPLMESVNLISNAELHMGVDSFSNHITHFKWGQRQTPALILWGSTQFDAAGYPENSNISLNLSCQPCFRESPKISAQPRGVCINPPGQDYDHPNHACMTGISVERVVAEVRRMWTS